MSAPIYSLLAEELDISEERAQKFLTAMLREVKKRAHRQGVRLPSLGTFREKEGHLTFEPADSLARTVNQRFEGLEDENLGRNAEDDRDDNQDNEGPSTITLGYQASDWSPIESSEADDSQTTDDSSEADTEEFQVLSSDEAADTEELQTQEALTDEQEKAPEDDATTDDSSADTEELYPLVEDVPETSEEEEASSPDTSSFEEADSTYEDLGEIWNEASPSEDAEKATVEPPPSQAESPTTQAEAAPSPSSPEPSSPPPRDSEPSEGSSLTSPILIAPLVLLFLGGGWYMLGQRGVLPPPSPTVAGVTGQLQEQVQRVPLFQKSASPPSDGLQEETNPASDIVSDREEEPAPTDEDQESSELSSEEDDSSPSGDTSRDPALSEIDPSAGGWTIVVASRTDRAAADSLVASFRDRFENRSLPIDIVVGKAENTTRYRVAIGQYRTQSDVLQALDEHGEVLPEGAWPLNLR